MRISPFVSWYWRSVSFLFLINDGEKVGWIWFLYDDSDEVEGDNYGVSNFLGVKTWRVRFPDGDCWY